MKVSFWIKSNFSDHINMLLLTKSSFLSQYEYLLRRFSIMSTLHFHKLGSFMYLNIFLTGDPKRVSHLSNESDTVTCLRL